MKILVSWLRDFVTIDVGIQTLADALTAHGFEVSSIEPPPITARGESQEDAVLDLEITTNRPDCLSIFGIAREVSTIFKTPLRLPTPGAIAKEQSACPIELTVDNPDLCPRYTASAAQVTVGPSPDWLASRLEATGIRPINNIVDITNYVMAEMGHPMHAFDLERLDGQHLHVRRARAKEMLKTLDGIERSLAEDMLVIADDSTPQAIAGVIGGASSEVSTTTKHVAFESAYFLPTSIRRTSKRLPASTDASYRFERGADINAPVTAMRRAQELMSAIGAGQIIGKTLDHYPSPQQNTVIGLRLSRINRVLGVTIDAPFVSDVLQCLGFGVELLPDPATQWRISVPSFRVDVKLEIDLIEEVIRHHGYDRLPATFPELIRPPAPLSNALQRQRLLRRILTASGCFEAITYGFIDKSIAKRFVLDEKELASMANPLSEKLAVLRPSLIPGLIDALIRNRRREQEDIRLFEIGHRFSRQNGETSGVAIALTGAGTLKHWSAERRSSDLFDLKGIIEKVSAAIELSVFLEPNEYPWLVPGRSAVVRASCPGQSGTKPVGSIGQLLPELAIERGLPAAGEAVYVAELDFDELSGLADGRSSLNVTPLPRHPSIIRDIAIVVDRALPAATVRDTIRSVSADSLVEIHEFDRYEGKGVPSGSVSLAFRLTFRRSDRTLTDVEIIQTLDKIVETLKTTHQATLR